MFTLATYAYAMRVISETFSYVIKNYVMKHLSTINSIKFNLILLKFFFTNGVNTVRKDILKR